MYYSNSKFKFKNNDSNFLNFFTESSDLERRCKEERSRNSFMFKTICDSYEKQKAAYKSSIETAAKKVVAEKAAANLQKVQNLEDFLKGKNTCIDFESALDKLNQSLADRYNLTDSEIKLLEERKLFVESKIKDAKCLEQKQQAAAETLGKLSSELETAQKEAEAKQKKLIRNVLIGVGGLVVVVVLIKLIQK